MCQRKGIMKKSTLEESILTTARGTSSRRILSKRSLSFDTVEIREHQIIWDTPTISNTSNQDPVSIALTVSWKPVSTNVLTVEEFECSRRPGGRKLLPLSTGERVAVLMNAGYTLREICKLDKQNMVKPRTTFVARLANAAKNFTKAR